LFFKHVAASFKTISTEAKECQRLGAGFSNKGGMDMTKARSIALYTGMLLLLFGILGLIFLRGNGMLFNIVQVNTLLEFVYALVGAALLFGATNTNLAHRMASVFGLMFLALAVVGFFSASLFGLIPLNGANILLHLALGVVLVYDWLATPEGQSPIVMH
jgi:Domain of unknown function (DUF4383)